MSHTRLVMYFDEEYQCQLSRDQLVVFPDWWRTRLPASTINMTMMGAVWVERGAEHLFTDRTIFRWNVSGFVCYEYHGKAGISIHRVDPSIPYEVLWDAIETVWEACACVG